MAAFSNDLQRNSGPDRGAGQVSLEFYQKKKRWIGQEDIPWEVWTVRCELVHLVNEQERLSLQEKVGEMLSDKVKSKMIFPKKNLSVSLVFLFVCPSHLIET